MKQSKESLDAINILKGTAYSQLMLEDERVGLCQASNIDLALVFSQMDTKGVGKVYSADLIKFLSVHRIAISEREGDYLLYMIGTSHPYFNFENFAWYITNGEPAFANTMVNSQSHHRGQLADQMIKNYGEREVAKILEKEIEFYRTIEQLKEEYVKKYGFTFKNVISSMDRERSGKVSAENLIEFVRRYGVELSREEFEAIGRKNFCKSTSDFTYKEMIQIFSPFEPLNFPTYRKQNNFNKALDYINHEVAKLQINTKSLPYEGGAEKMKTTTGFNKVMENYRNPGVNTESLNSKYFYDQNYYSELKKYRTNYFDPNKDIKKKVQNQMIGPQYHDHFFSDYYLYLEERNKLELYYNKFGKRYTFENPISKAYDAKS